MALLPCVEVETADSPDAAIIWLHGLGADGHDFEGVIPELRLPQGTAWRFIFPHAPSIPVTVNNGYVMPAWYDILEMDLDRRVDTAQLRDSADAVGKLLERELERGVAAERIIIAGFSQGGAVAYELALSYPQRLAGLMALSSYFATADSIALSEANRDLPVFIAHGRFDPVVPEMLGRRSYDHLQSLNYPCEFRDYPMEHSVNLEEIQDISAWLQGCLSI